MKFDIVRSNIINIPADAIVLPANPQLKEGSGASSAIFQAAGRKKLTEACKKIGKCEVGSAVPTLAYDLDAQYIIHAVVPVWKDGKHNEYELLSASYLSALNLADIMACKTVAFPLLASGNNGYDLELAFQIAKESIESFSGTKLEKVILVLYGDHIVSIVKNQGYSVIDIPDMLKKGELKQIHKEKAKQMSAEGKEIAMNFLEEQIQNGLNYLKDPKNQKEILSTGIYIAKLVLGLTKKKK